MQLGNQEKSPSVEHSVSPRSSASAAKCASGTRFASAPIFDKKVAKNFGMAPDRLGNPNRLAIKPGEYMIPCFINLLWLFEDARVGDEMQEYQEACPLPRA